MIVGIYDMGSSNIDRVLASGIVWWREFRFNLGCSRACHPEVASGSRLQLVNESVSGVTP